MSKMVVIGWTMQLVGTVFWVYGYFASGHPSLINWSHIAPWWIADWLPNLESEIAMLLVFAGILPIYWPQNIKDASNSNK
jgi:hypothetical protein